MDTIQLESVTKTFRQPSSLLGWVGRDTGTNTRALDNVSLTAAAREILVLLGPNGSGKTTLLKLLSTMLLPDSGRIVVCGADTRQNADQVRRQVGFVVASERSFFPRLTARENLDLFAALDNVPRQRRPSAIAAALEQAGLTTEADNLVMTFSSGMYQKLGLARALIKRPAVLLLDEPTRSIDAGTSLHIWELLRRIAAARSTLVLATHRFEEAAAIAHSIAYLRNGRLLTKQCLPQGASADDLRSSYFREMEDFARNALVCGGAQ
jgi:ABC-2 type transport system ATP-binding protein